MIETPVAVLIHTGSQERKRGNTVYVHGRGISHELCDKAFKKFGTIANINMEQEKRWVSIVLVSATGFN